MMTPASSRGTPPLALLSDCGPSMPRYNRSTLRREPRDVHTSALDAYLDQPASRAPAPGKHARELRRRSPRARPPWGRRGSAGHGSRAGWVGASEAGVNPGEGGAVGGARGLSAARGVGGAGRVPASRAPSLSLPGAGSPGRRQPGRGGDGPRAAGVAGGCRSSSTWTKSIGDRVSRTCARGPRLRDLAAHRAALPPTGMRGVGDLSLRPRSESPQRIRHVHGQG